PEPKTRASGPTYCQDTVPTARAHRRFGDPQIRGGQDIKIQKSSRFKSLASTRHASRNTRAAVLAQQSPQPSAQACMRLETVAAWTASAGLAERRARDGKTKEFGSGGSMVNGEHRVDGRTGTKIRMEPGSGAVGTPPAIFGDATRSRRSKSSRRPQEPHARATAAVPSFFGTRQRLDASRSAGGSSRLRLSQRPRSAIDTQERQGHELVWPATQPSSSSRFLLRITLALRTEGAALSRRGRIQAEEERLTS
ncbi:hypothetical protein CF326_g9446, partial [Tilletia indica]